MIDGSFRWRVLASAILFAVGLAVGALGGPRAPGTPGTPKVTTRPQVAGATARSPRVQPAPILFVLRTNLATATVMAAGLVTFGLAPLLHLPLVGFAVGSAILTASQGVRNPLTLTAYLLPHGVVEVPALLLAGAAGLSGLYCLKDLTRGDRASAMARCRSAIREYGCAVLLLIVAAVLERYVTFALLDRLSLL